MALPTNDEESLNVHHKRRLLISCEHVDRLLADVEAILLSSASKSPFPKYRDDTAPIQRKVSQDYIGRLRAQLVRVLEGQDIVHPGPSIGSIHAIRVILNFVDIAAEELKPKYMRGYGEIPESKKTELNGIANEIQGIVKKLDLYLAQGLGQDLQGRLERLERPGDEIVLLKTIERIIMDHGLVEFRSPLSIILDRLEEERFEIAFFGRVSAGKSSLLNHILGADTLPVGVNPITAIPTRVMYGAEARLEVHFADRKPEAFDVSRLAEFATEPQNPANAKHVTGINVELPSARLRDGVAFVDTPGLGSLATSGAAETLAYLPRCDLGVVLIDAGSTLTQEDLATIQALYEASTPAQILLSKADLHTPTDRAQALKYIESHIHSELGLDLKAHAVSIIGDDVRLLDRWFEEEIAALYDHHQQLRERSINRKIGSLREALEAALKLKLERAAQGIPTDQDGLKEIETELRRAGGKIEETRALCRAKLDEIAGLEDLAYERAATRVVEEWPNLNGDNTRVSETVRSAFQQVAGEEAKKVREPLESLKSSLVQVLDAAAKSLKASDESEDEGLGRVVKEMPRLDLGEMQLNLRFNFLVSFGEKIAKARVEKELRRQSDGPVSSAVASYGKLLESWTLRTLEDLQRRFSARADWYRARIEQMSGGAKISVEDEQVIKRDLEELARRQTEAEAVTR